MRVRARKCLAISNSLSRLDPPTWSPASESERAMIDAGGSGRARRARGQRNRVLMVDEEEKEKRMVKVRRAGGSVLRPGEI